MKIFNFEIKSLYVFLTLIFILVAFLFSSSLVFQDLSIYWAATKYFYSGRNPYSLPSHLTYIFGSIGKIDPSAVPLQAWIPPFAFIPIFPFFMFSLKLCKAIYLFIFLIFFSSWALKLFDFFALFKKRNDFILKLFLVLIATLFLTIGLLVLQIGAITWCLYFAGVCLSAHFYNRKRFFLSGFFLFPLYFKIQFFVFIFVALYLSEIFNRRLRFIVGSLSSGFLLIATSYIINPEAYLGYDPIKIIKFLEGYIYITNFLGKTLFVTGIDLRMVSLACLFISAIAGVIYAIRCKRLELKIEQQFMAFIPISVSLSPYGWNHDCAVLIPSYITLAIFYISNYTRHENDMAVFGMFIILGLISFNIHSYQFSSLMLMALNIYTGEMLLKKFSTSIPIPNQKDIL